MKRKLPAAVMITALLLLASFFGCGRREDAPEPTKAVSYTGTPETAEPDASTETGTETGMRDGERFETVVVLEGMEETVGYEHVRNEAAGFELDYEYALLERHSEGDYECFVSRWEEPDDPRNFLEIEYCGEGADAAAARIRETLSDRYDTVAGESYTLARAGSCVRISASGARDGKAVPGSLQTVYIIPAGDGCLVAAANCTQESAEGFGARFSQMLNTLTRMDG